MRGGRGPQQREGGSGRKAGRPALARSTGVGAFTTEQLTKDRRAALHLTPLDPGAGFWLAKQRWLWRSNRCALSGGRSPRLTAASSMLAAGQRGRTCVMRSDPHLLLLPPAAHREEHGVVPQMLHAAETWCTGGTLDSARRTP